MSEILNELKTGNHVVKLWADWCGPCKAYAPVFKEATEGVTVAKVHEIDVDAHSELAQHFGVRGIPTTLFIKEGQVLEARAGTMTAAEIKAEILKLS